MKENNTKNEHLEELENKQYRRGIAVYACQSDTTHPKVLELAKGAGAITQERYEVLSNPDKGVRPILEPEELEVILETYFGFNKGIYQEYECHGIQKGRFGQRLAGELRYTGEERTDKDWVETGLASREAKEKSKYGGFVRMDEHDGYSELSIDDVLGRGLGNSDY